MVENDYKHLSPTAISLLIVVLLTGEDESVLDRIPGSCMEPLITWVGKELVEERVMKVEGWLEMAFHLCKQRWDQSIEWLEQQPMSKVLLMMRVQSNFNEKEAREMKKNSRKRK